MRFRIYDLSRAEDHLHVIRGCGWFRTGEKTASFHLGTSIVGGLVYS